MLSRRLGGIAGKLRLEPLSGSLWRPLLLLAGFPVGI
jgi:hypothetical protein